MTLLFKELAGSPRELYGTVGMKAERRLLCAYEDRLAAVAVLLGQGRRVRRPAGGAVSRAARRPSPSGCGSSRSRNGPTTRAQFADLTADLNNYSNQFAQLVVELRDDRFGPRPKLPKVQARDDPQLSHGLRRRIHSPARPEPALAIRRDVPVPPEVVPTLRIPIVEHHVTWRRVLDPPWDAIRTCAGAVNSAAFLGAAAETVLFDGAKAEPRIHRPGQFPRTPVRLADRPTSFGKRLIKVVEGAVGPQTYGWNHTYRDVPFPFGCWDRLVDQYGSPCTRRWTSPRFPVSAT